MKRVNKILDEMRAGSRAREISLPYLQQVVDAPSKWDLISYTSRLASEGKLKIKYRLLSPQTKMGLKEFDHLFDVPDFFLDESTDQKFKVKIDRDVEQVFLVSEANGLA